MFIPALFIIPETWKQPKCPLTDEWIKKMYSRDFPGGLVVKNLPSSAGDVGSIRGWGIKIPHAAGELLSLCALESACHNLRACVPQLLSFCTTTRENLHAATKDPACHNDDPACRS